MQVYGKCKIGETINLPENLTWVQGKTWKPDRVQKNWEDRMMLFRRVDACRTLLFLYVLLMA